MKNIVRALTLTGILSVAAAAAQAQVGIAVGVRTAPVVAGVEVGMPPCPGDGYVWQPGYYVGSYWYPGQWVYQGYGPAYYGRAYYGGYRAYDRDDYYRHYDRDDYRRYDRDDFRYRDHDDYRNYDHDRGEHRGWDHDRRYVRTGLAGMPPQPCLHAPVEAPRFRVRFPFQDFFFAALKSLPSILLGPWLSRYAQASRRLEPGKACLRIPR